MVAESDAAELLSALEQAEARYPNELHAEHRNNAHLAFPFLAELASDSRIVDRVVTIVGGDISLSSTVMFIKEPSSSGFDRAGIAARARANAALALVLYDGAGETRAL